MYTKIHFDTCLNIEQVYNGLLNLEFLSFFPLHNLLSRFRSEINFAMYDTYLIHLDILYFSGIFPK